MHWNNRSAYVRLVGTLLASTASALLAGCGVAASTPSTNYTTPVTLQGQVFAGRNYMAGATVNVYATQPSGTASNGSYTGSAKLLATTTANTTGGFSLTGVSCSSPDQLYVTAVGGVPYPSGVTFTSLTNNPNSVLLTAIGDCSILTSATATTNITSIVVDEASTVAAVWALRNFISLNGTTVNITSDASNYAGTGGVGTVGNYAGLAHGFLNANNLSPYKLGNFQQYTFGSNTGTAAGLVPVQELNSLAYAQYLCTIGTPDGITPGNFSLCTSLYQLATPPGGAAPANSLQAMLNIARYPANNSDAIMAFTLTPIPGSGQTAPQVINAGVYVPALTAFGTLTDDWSVAIFYLPPYGATSSGQGTIYPINLAIDANDDVFVSNPNASTGTAGNVVALSSTGAPLWTSTTDTTKLVDPRGIAADASGNLWIVNGTTTTGSGFVEQMSAMNGATIATYPSSSTSLYAVAVDSLGDVWYDANSSVGQNLHELVKSGTTYAEAVFAVPPSSPAQTLLQLRPDSKNNIWAAGYNSTTATAAYFANTGTTSAPTYTTGLKFSTLGGNSGYGITPDPNGNAYSVTDGAGNAIFLTTVTGTGAAATLTPAVAAPAPVPTAALSARYMDIDGTGTVWFADASTGTKLYQFVPGSAGATAYYPCFNAGTTTGSNTSQTCTTGISTRLDFAIDSTGSIWVMSYGNSGGGRLAQIIGLASPTVPLKAVGKIGVMP